MSDYPTMVVQDGSKRVLPERKILSLPPLMDNKSITTCGITPSEGNLETRQKDPLQQGTALRWVEEAEI